MTCGKHCRSIGVFDNKDTVSEKQEKEEEEHKQGIAKHDVFGMSIKAKDVDEDGDVRATDTNMQACSAYLTINQSNNHYISNVLGTNWGPTDKSSVQ